jgi:hypothetical protein
MTNLMLFYSYDIATGGIFMGNLDLDYNEPPSKVEAILSFLKPISRTGTLFFPKIKALAVGLKLSESCAGC